MKSKAHQDICNLNAQLVGEWVDSVNPKEVPMNQFGRPSVEKILIEVLGLKKSARYNGEIKGHFERLTKRLKSPEMKLISRAQGSREEDKVTIQELQSIIKKRELRIVILENTIFGLQQEIAAGKHTVETGRLIRR